MVVGAADTTAGAVEDVVLGAVSGATGTLKGTKQEEGWSRKTSRGK